MRRSPMRPEIGARNSVKCEIELGLPNQCFIGQNDCLGSALGLLALFEGLLGDGLIAHKLLAANKIGFCEGEIGPLLRERCARA